ncbi:MAG: lysylphosphatidylglycerol synthase transmembrane domain-containing protein [Bryobacteraceae bacterium]
MTQKPGDSLRTSSQPPAGRRAAARFWIIAGIALILGLLWLASRYWGGQNFEWQRFLAVFARLDPWWLAASLMLSLLTYVGRAFRWRIFIRPVQPHPGLWRLFTATAIGFTAIVLFGRPGEMVRPYLIARKEGVSFSSQMAAWLLERIYDLLMALLIFGFALSRVRASGIQAGSRLSWVLEGGGYFVGVIGLVCVAVLVGFRMFGERGRERVFQAIEVLPDPLRLKVRGFIDAFAGGIESTKSWGAVAGVFGYSILEWVLIVACNYCIFRALPDTAGFSLTDILIFIGFVAFGGVVQIPGVGGGVQIVTVLVLTELFGMPLEISSGMAVLLWIITFVVIVPLGLFLAFQEGLQWSKLRQIGEEGQPGK